MLFVKPELKTLDDSERENIQQLFCMIHGYLFKAGSKNSRVKTKTMNVAM